MQTLKRLGKKKDIEEQAQARHDHVMKAGELQSCPEAF
jgi:hypothetical protein